MLDVGFETPFDRRGLAVGSYVFRISHEGYAPVRVPFIVQRARTTHLRVPLLRPLAIPEGFVYVPPGPAILGGDEAAIRSLPREVADVPGFLMAVHEVTVAEYLAFVNAQPKGEAKPYLPRGSRKQGFAVLFWPEADGSWSYPRTWPDDRPITGITWEAATAYCAWRSIRDGVRYRLPTEREWEKACRGADGRPYPWGEAPPGGRANVPEAAEALSPLPIGSRPDDVSVFGIFDMIGNAAEWTRSGYDERLLHRVVRGGAWVPMTDEPRAAARFPVLTQDAPHYIGFRLVIDPPG